MPTTPPKDIVFVKEGERTNKKEEPIVGVKATRGNANHNDFAGKYNPSYVLMKSKDGYVYAKYVGTTYHFHKWYQHI